VAGEEGISAEEGRRGSIDGKGEWARDGSFDASSVKGAICNHARSGKYQDLHRDMYIKR